MHLPGMDGTAVMQHAKEIQPNLLVIVLTGYASVDTAIAAVKHQAADYLRKPVRTQLLSDTIQRILSENAARLHKEKIANAIIDYMGIADGISPFQNSKNKLYLPPVSLDLVNRYIVIDNFANRISLSPGEAKVLECLMRHPNETLTSKYIAEHVMEAKFDGIDANKIVRPYISRLRKKAPYLNEYPKILDTVHGIGYIFRPRA